MELGSESTLLTKLSTSEGVLRELLSFMPSCSSIFNSAVKEQLWVMQSWVTALDSNLVAFTEWNNKLIDYWREFATLINQTNQLNREPKFEDSLSTCSNERNESPSRSPSSASISTSDSTPETNFYDTSPIPPQNELPIDSSAYVASSFVQGGLIEQLQRELDLLEPVTSAMDQVGLNRVLEFMRSKQSAFDCDGFPDISGLLFDSIIALLPTDCTRLYYQLYDRNQNRRSLTDLMHYVEDELAGHYYGRPKPYKNQQNDFYIAEQQKALVEEVEQKFWPFDEPEMSELDLVRRMLAAIGRSHNINKQWPSHNRPTFSALINTIFDCTWARFTDHLRIEFVHAFGEQAVHSRDLNALRHFLSIHRCEPVPEKPQKAKKKASPDVTQPYSVTAYLEREFGELPVVDTLTEPDQIKLLLTTITRAMYQLPAHHNAAIFDTAYEKLGPRIAELFSRFFDQSNRSLGELKWFLTRVVDDHWRPVVKRFTRAEVRAELESLDIATDVDGVKRLLLTMAKARNFELLEEDNRELFAEAFAKLPTHLQNRYKLRSGQRLYGHLYDLNSFLTYEIANYYSQMNEMDAEIRTREEIDRQRHAAADEDYKFCRYCKKLGHRAEHCPDLVNQVCFRCFDTGHKARNCEYRELCQRCATYGHNWTNCPEKGTNY